MKKEDLIAIGRMLGGEHGARMAEAGNASAKEFGEVLNKAMLDAVQGLADNDNLNKGVIGAHIAGLLDAATAMYARLVATLWFVTGIDRDELRDRAVQAITKRLDATFKAGDEITGGRTVDNIELKEIGAAPKPKGGL